MQYEIDFIPVGEGERGGDAICLRFGEKLDKDNQQVIVIDGGTRESGDTIVKHINRYYGTNTVNLAILTHPDCDHASGMREVLEQMDVKVLWMHKPWEHAENIKHLFENNNMQNAKLKKYVKENLESANEVCTIATSKKIKIIEPFSDNCNFEYLKVLSPSKSFYESLLADFTCTPNVKESMFTEFFKAAKEKVTNYLDENWDIETLGNPDDSNSNYGTRPENNSSVVLYLDLQGKKFLFTGDAGVTALQEAHNKAVSYGIDLRNVNFYQIPHHGSKRNVGPDILNSIVGKVVATDTYTKIGYISCPEKGSPKHPSKKVINAFKRRGVQVYSTSGIEICHPCPNAPDRGWVSATPLLFNYKVEED